MIAYLFFTCSGLHLARFFVILRSIVVCFFMRVCSDKYYYIRYASRSENLCESSILLNDDIYNTEFTRTDSLAIRASQSIDNVTDLFGKNNLQRSVYSLNGVNGTLDDMK